MLVAFEIQYTLGFLAKPVFTPFSHRQRRFKREWRSRERQEGLKEFWIFANINRFLTTDQNNDYYGGRYRPPSEFSILRRAFYLRWHKKEKAIFLVTDIFIIVYGLL